jgi:hypothetical protein
MVYKCGIEIAFGEVDAVPVEVANIHLMVVELVV